MPLKRVLSPELTLYKEPRFPYRNSRRERYRYRTVVGIGGNVGDVRRRFHRLFVALQRQSGIQVIASGPVLQNPPFGYLDQPDFFNSVLELSTSMQPRAFLRYLLRLEKRFGRKRSFANAPRTLDLDILFFDGRVVNKTDLQIPHPHWHERESVVIPLTYLGVM
ncbi:MAG: 2-amino-4-hydroxy-6-hydroxymethyldihydropteridine diphosphokinase [Sulfurimonadaceae bacterium]|nr:2-amino-4-hydroxy-6-hydroxymethyldihydropteridine diphosphokinase [Sulfurimonadaceae bacterium]